MKSNNYGRVWFNKQLRPFKEYDNRMYIRVRIGNKWEYVKTDDVIKWPKEKS